MKKTHGEKAAKKPDGRKSTPFDAVDYLRRWAEEVDRSIESALPRELKTRDLLRYTGPADWDIDIEACTRMLSTPLWDLIDRDGKRWRAVFALRLLESMGRDSAPFRTLLLAVPELVHTASLVIDDIEDGSPLRRGEEAIHLRHGLATAINAANTAYFLPFHLVLEHPALTLAEKRRIVEILQRQFIRAHLGQALDLYWSRNLDEDNLERWMADGLDEKILQMYAFKTGALLEATAEAAAVIARCDRPVLRAAATFARHFGVAFQLIDDIHNFSRSPGWRKEHAEDLREGKPTCLIVRALGALPAPDRRRLRQILCTPELRGDPQIREEGAALVLRSGVIDSVRQEARRLVGGAWTALAKHLPRSDARKDLGLLWKGLVEWSFDGKAGRQV